MAKERLTIIIPAYNEEKTVGNVIRNIKKEIGQYDYEILVIDDGSRDRTAEISKENGAIVFSHPYNCGLAEAFRTGIKKALERKANTIVHIDADGQYLASDIPRLIKPIIEKRADLVLGSRFKGKIEKMPLIKRLGNKAFSWVISNIVKIRISDAQTGFRAFTRQIAEKIKIISDYTYTQEMTIKAIKEKFKIVEVPVYFGRRWGKSRLLSNPFSYAIKAWINLLRVYRDYEPLKFFGLVGLFFIGVSLILGFYLLWIVLTTAGLGQIDEKIPTILLAVVLFTIGLQIILFGFLADSRK